MSPPGAEKGVWVDREYYKKKDEEKEERESKGQKMTQSERK